MGVQGKRKNQLKKKRILLVNFIRKEKNKLKINKRRNFFLKENLKEKINIQLKKEQDWLFSMRYERSHVKLIFWSIGEKRQGFEFLKKRKIYLFKINPVSQQRKIKNVNLVFSRVWKFQFGRNSFERYDPLKSWAKQTLV